jgi:hypothetical protein
MACESVGSVGRIGDDGVDVGADGQRGGRAEVALVDQLLRALRAGARSYLAKDADRDDIAKALRSAVAGLRSRILRCTRSCWPRASDRATTERSSLP